MLYLADNLEPGRRGRKKERAKLAKRVPQERDAVLREVVQREMEERLRDGRPINPLTLAFWNSILGR
jgi:HD superfamily phosphohydrolase YqeK